MHVYDPVESAFPKVGLVRLKDPETGKTILVDAGDSNVRKVFENSYVSRLRDFKEMFKRAKSDTMSFSVDQSYIQELHKFFKRRASG